MSLITYPNNKVENEQAIFHKWRYKAKVFVVLLELQKVCYSGRRLWVQRVRRRTPVVPTGVWLRRMTPRHFRNNSKRNIKPRQNLDDSTIRTHSQWQWKRIPVAKCPSQDAMFGCVRPAELSLNLRPWWGLVLTKTEIHFCCNRYLGGVWPRVGQVRMPPKNRADDRTTTMTSQRGNTAHTHCTRF